MCLQQWEKEYQWLDIFEYLDKISKLPEELQQYLTIRYFLETAIGSLPKNLDRYGILEDHMPEKYTIDDIHKLNKFLLGYITGATKTMNFLYPRIKDAFDKFCSMHYVEGCTQISNYNGGLFLL